MLYQSAEKEKKLLLSKVIRKAMLKDEIMSAALKMKGSGETNDGKKNPREMRWEWS